MEPRAGVHAIGKKIVEEAAEVWMAAEYEDGDRTAEEISQLLYHVQVLMLAARSDTRRRIRSSLENRAAAPAEPTLERAHSHAPHRRAEQGLAVRARGRPCCGRPATASARDARELVLQDPDNSVEFFFLRCPATSPSTSAPAAWTWASPAATCCWTPAPGRGGARARLRWLDLPLRRAARHRRRGRFPHSAGCGSPPRSLDWSPSTWPSTWSAAEALEQVGVLVG